MRDSEIPTDSRDLKTVPEGLELPIPPEREAQMFAQIVGHMLDDKLRPVIANQDLTLGEVRELSARIGTIEKRLHIGEGRFDRIEGEIRELRRKIDEQEAKVLALEKMLLDDGR